MEQDMGRDEAETAAEPAAGKERLKQLLLQHGIAAVALLIAIIAVVVALRAGGRHEEFSQFGEIDSKLDGVAAELATLKSDLEGVKLQLAREKSIRAEELKAAEERTAKVVANVSHLQEKLKVSPTLEMQLHTQDAPRSPGVAVAPVSPPPQATPPAMPAAAAVVAPQAATKAADVVPAPVPQTADKPAAPPPKLKEMKPGSNKENNRQVDTLKKAIDLYNR